MITNDIADQPAPMLLTDKQMQVEVILEVLDAYGKCVERDVARIEKWGDICKWDDNDLDLAKTHIDTFKVLSQTIKSILTSD